jgi:hypothetical protein
VNEGRAEVEIFFQPYCGDAPCNQDDAEATALLTRRVRISGFDIPCTDVKLGSEISGIPTVTLVVSPTALSTLTVVDPWDPRL